MGKHLFLSYFLDHYDSFGSATITKNNGVYELVGSQTKREIGLKLMALLTLHHLMSSCLTGLFMPICHLMQKDTTRGACTKKDNEYFWSGSARFISFYEGTVYWRMQAGSNRSKPCFGHLGNVDLFFD